MCLPMVGAVIGAVGTMVSAMTAAKSYEMEAKAQERQNALELEAGNYEAERTTREGERILGQQRAAGAASGLDISTGAMLETQSDTGTELQRDIDAIRYNARVQGDNALYKAKVARVNKGSAMAGGVIGSMGTLVNGVNDSLQQGFKLKGFFG